MTELIGRIFDRKYRLIRLIGEGGMGSVFEAEHTLIERKVAVKVVHEEFSSSEEVVGRFFREAQASSAIGHPNIIEIFDVGKEEDGTAFIVMELLRGKTLAAKLKEDGAMPPTQAVSVILQVLSALAASHEKGIIHRDLKPDNVFLAIDNRGRHEVKLLDFGIAKMQFESETDQGLTKTGTVLGTPNYMSPEAARGKDIDGRIDIWAAGVMLYEMLSGNLPFRGASYNAVLSDILLETPTPVRHLAPGLPQGLVKVVEKAMEKDRNRRYHSVPAMIAELLPFNEDASMSDSAAIALKNSLMPAPALNDTLLYTPPPLSRTVSEDVAPFTSNSLGTRSAPPQSQKRSGFFFFFVLLLIAAGGFAALSFYFKKPNQTVVESAAGLSNHALNYWKSSSLWPFETGPHMPPEIEEPEISAEPPEYDDAGVLEAGAISMSETVTLSIEGAPKNARILLDGKPIQPNVRLPKTNTPALLEVTAPKSKPYKTKIVLDQDRVVNLKSKKTHSVAPKTKKSRSKKTGKSR